MEVVAIRDISEGEEVGTRKVWPGCIVSECVISQITIPYLDPALPLDTRTDALRMNYGFTCGCEFCSFQRQLGSIKPLPADASLVHALEDKLRAHVAARSPNTDSHGPSSPSNATPWVDLPADLYPLFNEGYLPQLSETFSRTSHEGEYEAALSSGRTLSAYYAVVYPPNYPQIGAFIPDFGLQQSPPSYGMRFNRVSPQACTHSRSQSQHGTALCRAMMLLRLLSFHLQ